jgi:hypothetical protein
MHVKKIYVIFIHLFELQLVNLHRNRRYFVIKLHTWFLSIIFLEDKHKILLHLSIFYEYQVFSTPYLFLDTAKILTEACLSNPIMNTD